MRLNLHVSLATRQCQRAAPDNSRPEETGPAETRYWSTSVFGPRPVAHSPSARMTNRPRRS